MTIAALLGVLIPALLKALSYWLSLRQDSAARQDLGRTQAQLEQTKEALAIEQRLSQIEATTMTPDAIMARLRAGTA